jgi:hypothetical protein
MLALACDFRQRGATSTWQRLERSSNRCGGERLISVVHAAPGQSVAVPAPKNAATIVVATIDIPSSLGSRLTSLVFKPPSSLTVTADGITFRLTLASASGPMIVRLPRSVWSATFDGGSSYRSLRVGSAATYVFRSVALLRARAG